MSVKTPKKILCPAGWLLFFLLLFCLPPPDQAEAAPVSRITAAKGNGLMGLVQRWNYKYIKKDSPQKYKNRREVVGYYTRDWVSDNQSQQSLQANAERITGLATFSYRVNSSGQITGELPGKALATAWDNNIEVLALVHNLSSSEFDRSLIHSILKNPNLRSETISSIYKTLIRHGFDGVNIDFENIPAGDRPFLNGFVSELREKLRPEGLKVTISVPAKTSDDPQAWWGGAYDYEHLAGDVDRVMLMTYDEHFIQGPPGPIASSPWVERVITYSRRVIPKDKLLLGIGNYGYDWNVGRGGYQSVSAKNALTMARRYGVSIKWDDSNQTPYFYYWRDGQKHVVWFESTPSAAFKLNLVKNYDLKGIAVWRLGFESSDFWPMVEQKLNS